MSSKASIYEEYKRAEREAFGELFRGQPYTSWPVKTFYVHLPPFLKPSVATAVIKNLQTSLKLRGKIAEFYAAASTTQTYIRHEYFKRCLDHLIDAVSHLPPPPTKTKSGHNRYGVLRTQAHIGDDESQGDESPEATKCTTQRREEQTPTINLDETSLEDMDRLTFQDVVQTFILQAGENWQNAVGGKSRLSTASIMSDVEATELQAILSAAELSYPSWFKSHDRYSWDLKDHKIDGVYLGSSCCASGLSPSYLPVAIHHLMTSQIRADPLRCLVWKNIIHASSNAATETEVNRLRRVVKQELEETLDLCRRHRGLLKEDSRLDDTAPSFRAWAQSADILSIGKIAEFAEGYLVIIYRMVLELPSITMFAYLCEYVRIEKSGKHKQTLPEPLESWFEDRRLSKLLWWNERPHNLKHWKTAVHNWVLPNPKGVAIAKRRHKLPLFQRISENNYSCSIMTDPEQLRPLSEVLEEEQNTPNTDSIRTCVLDTVRASLGPIGSEWGEADRLCATRMYQECREGKDPQSIMDAFIKRWEAGHLADNGKDAAGGRFADTVGLAQEITQGVAKRCDSLRAAASNGNRS